MAHICKHIKQISKHNSISKHNTTSSEHNTVLSKHNTTSSEHNTVLSKHNTIHRNTTQYLQNTTQISQNTTQYLQNTTQNFPDYVLKDVNIIQSINPSLLNRWHVCTFPPFLFAILLGKMFCASCRAGLKSFSKFCPFCSQKVENDSSASVTDEGATKCTSFKNYAAKKSEEGSIHLRSSGSKRRGQKKKE